MSQSSKTDAGQGTDFVHLLSKVETKHQSRQNDCVRFLLELPPLMDAARRIDRELDFQIAHRFNALRYLRYDELGLSKVIADLLDPTCDHGQGTIFLDTMLELLSVAPEVSNLTQIRHSQWLRESTLLNTDSIRVQTERATDTGRRIDITVDFKTSGGDLCCLAFENKPYAGDQHEQCSDYLKFLKSRYGTRFMLVYIPSRKRLPEGFSDSEADCWVNHFRVLPYASQDLPDDRDYAFESTEPINKHIDDTTNRIDTESLSGDLSRFLVGKGTTLADWFRICSTRSNAERLRWFLQEAQHFCQQHFGKSNMTDTEARFVTEYLEKHPDRATSAFAVARAWPYYMHDVCERFLRHLASKVRDELSTRKHENLKVMARYENLAWGRTISIYKDSWQPYTGDPTKHHSELRTAIYLESHESQEASYWGVRRPKGLSQMNESESSKENQLSEQLHKQGLSNSNNLYLHVEEPKYFGWAEIVGKLAKELDKGEGEITKYYVDGLCRKFNELASAIDVVGFPNSQS